MSKTQVAKGPVKGNEIISKLIKGAEKACFDYMEISGNPFPGSAPESFIQAGAALGLKKFKSTWVVLEESVAATYKSSQSTKGPLKSSVAKGRYDIVAYWGHGKPRAAIEVKSPVNALVRSKFEKDFNRLLQTMNGHPDASFQYGIFLFLSVKKGKKSTYEKSKIEIDMLVEKLGLEAAELVDKKSRKKINPYLYQGKCYPIKTEDENGAWQISAIVFKR